MRQRLSAAAKAARRPAETPTATAAAATTTTNVHNNNKSNNNNNKRASISKDSREYQINCYIICRLARFRLRAGSKVLQWARSRGEKLLSWPSQCCCCCSSRKSPVSSQAASCKRGGHHIHIHIVGRGQRRVDCKTSAAPLLTKPLRFAAAAKQIQPDGNDEGEKRRAASNKKAAPLTDRRLPPPDWRARQTGRFDFARARRRCCARARGGPHTHARLMGAQAIADAALPHA
jgi:hypothetical protein